ncbi:MAG: alkaline phosphatase family protein [Candidatus Hydrogenedentes bacterium]|nr:alkaline phosphatase family protein [Candidatus Hydrogenedentota bacterium]
MTIPLDCGKDNPVPVRAASILTAGSDIVAIESKGNMVNVVAKTYVNACRVLVIGLDCAAPRFIFGLDAFDLPNIRGVMERGSWGLLESCHPPITIPAWACMTTGKDPGELGCYGFRNRADYSYGAMVAANGATINAPRVWDPLSRQGKQCIVVGVPQTYPPRPLNGCLVSGIDTPDTSVDYTYPKSLKKEIERAVGEYIPDVRDFRTDDKAGLLARIYALMENRFAAAQYLMKNKPWDFFMMVEMGMDRLHHAFWKYCDPSHPKYLEGNPFSNVFREYYRAVDDQIGELLAIAGDDTTLFIVSDHGAKAMRGGLRLNQWLENEGYLKFAVPPTPGMRIEDCAVDWPNTRVWSAGGYYARLFLNVAGREPQGCVQLDHYESLRNELITKIASIPGPAGEPLQNRVLKPEDLYNQVHGVPPDLLVYPDDLNWRAIGTLGHETIYTDENDTGPDDANHDYHGILIATDKAPAVEQPVATQPILSVCDRIIASFM